MNETSPQNRLAVCSWSLRPTDAADLVAKLESTGLPRTQIALDPIRAAPDAWGDLADLCREKGVELVSGMFGAIGEDYSSLESIRRTGGVVPDETWSGNLTNITANAAIAESLGLKLVTFHAGFLPEQEDDPKFTVLIDRIRQLADLFGERGMNLGFETGQERAGTLNHFLDRLERSNVGGNFDPANMLIYNMDEPVEALRALAPRLLQCHIKDAVRPTGTGTKGGEVLAGEGEVNWPEFFAALLEVGYGGPLVIEREKGDRRVEDVRHAAALVVRIGG